MAATKLFRIRIWFTTPVTLHSGKIAQRRRDQVALVLAMGASASNALNLAFAKMRDRFPGSELRVMGDGANPWSVTEVVVMRIELSREQRRAINARVGQPGLATRNEVRRRIAMMLEAEIEDGAEAMRQTEDRARET